MKDGQSGTAFLRAGLAWLAASAWLCAVPPALGAPATPETPATPAIPPPPDTAAGATGGEHPVRFALTLGGEGNPFERCGGAEAVKEAVERRLKRPVFAPADNADSSFVVTAERPTVGLDWTAHIVELDRDGVELGQRDVVVRAEDCAKGVETIAVVLAITVGPPRMAPGPRPSRREASKAPPLAGPAPLPPLYGPPPPPTAPPRSVPARHWGVGPVVEFQAGTGIQPNLAFGIALGAVVTTPIRRLSLIARAEYWPPRSTDTTPEGSFDRISGAVLGCFAVFRQRSTTIDACAGADVGRLHANVPQVTRTSDTSLFVNAAAEGRLGYVLGRRGPFIFEPILAVQVAAVLRRDRFTYRNRLGQELTLLQPAPVAAQGAIGLAVHFL